MYHLSKIIAYCNYIIFSSKITPNFRHIFVISQKISVLRRTSILQFFKPLTINTTLPRVQKDIVRLILWHFEKFQIFSEFSNKARTFTHGCTGMLWPNRSDEFFISSLSRRSLRLDGAKFRNQPNTP